MVVEDIHLLKECIANYYDDNDNGCDNDNDNNDTNSTHYLTMTQSNTMCVKEQHVETKEGR